MGSISNPGISDLASILSLSGSPLASAAISSPTGQTSLENAPAGDLVELSSQALQLQETSSLFGTAATSSSADSLLSSLYTPSSADSLLSSLSSPANDLTSLVSSLAQNSSAAFTGTDTTQQTSSSSSSTSNSSNNSTPAEQIAAYVAAIQEQQTQVLFGSGSQTNSAPTTVNLLA